MITRRDFMSAGLFCAGASVGGLVISLADHRAQKKGPATPKLKLNTGPGVALSLSRYQEELRQTFQSGLDLPESLRTIYGLNRIDAILLEQDSEIVLVGDHDPALPAFELDDLVVALRNAFKVCPEYDGALGCTIDPTPGAADPWRIQIVKVFGMPASAPMGIRHVAIDYELKKVSAGLDPLSSGISSIYETSRQEAAPCQAGHGAAKAEPRNVTHRFWFTPMYPVDRPRFLQDDRGILIRKPINVQLQSEEEFLSNGRRVGGAPPQPAAVKFTESITKLLATNEVPDYARLRNDFRMIEVAKVMQFKNVSPEPLRYLLYECALRELPVRTKVGGIRRRENGEATCDAQVAESHAANGESTVTSEHIERYAQEFRGGVEARVDISPLDCREDSSGELERLRQRMRKSRLACASWRIPA